MFPKQTNNFKRLKSTKSPFQKTINLPQTSLPLIRKNITSFEKDVQKICGFSDLYDWQWKQHKGNKRFILHDGPPYANGSLHVGHAVNKILKDIIIRYKISQGFQVQYKPGWDCHGLPIENKAIKSDESFNLSPIEIRQRAKKFAKDAIRNQKSSFQHWAVTADWKDSCYHTFDKAYQVQEVECFYELYKKSLIYHDLKPVNWSPSSRTALAESELEYNPNHISKSVFVAFPLTSQTKSVLDVPKDTKLLVWTTQPWTLAGNKAIGYSDSIKYCHVTYDKCSLVVAVDTLQAISSRLNLHLKVMKIFDGSLFKGCTYLHPLDSSKESLLIRAPHVTTDMGTGLVHLAPAHGAEDFQLGKSWNLCTESTVDDEGYLTSKAGFNLEGKFIFTEGNECVVDQLVASGNLIHQHDYIHSYPYDWRSKQPIIIRTSKQWFIETCKLSEVAVKACESINYINDNGKNSMLSSLSQRDFWCISRQRVWGLPIPVFYCKHTDEVVISKHSINHLKKLFTDHGADAWWTSPISQLLPDHVIKSSGLPGKSEDYRRGEDILDIWFDSGVSWKTVLGDETDHATRADLYLEGRDQYNGWFYTSLITHLAFGHKVAPFKDLYTHGFVLCGDGLKMSKSVGNVVEPDTIVNGGKNLQANPAFGVDVLRWWVAESNTFRDIRISTSILESMKVNVQKMIEAAKMRCSQIRSTLRFIISNLNDFKHDQNIQLKPIDQFYLDHFKDLSNQINLAYENYKFSLVVQLLNNALVDLSKVYFTIVKDRLYCELMTSSARRSAQTCLYHICDVIMRAAAPILPHLIEEVYMHHPCQNSSKQSYFMTNHSNSCPDYHGNVTTNSVPLALKLRSALIAMDSNLSSYKVSIFSEDTKTLEKIQILHPTSDDFKFHSDLREILGCGRCRLLQSPPLHLGKHLEVEFDDSIVVMLVERTSRYTCPRCRLSLSTKVGNLCERCEDVLSSPWDEETTLYQ